jgi:hypothetical protein
MGEVCLHPRGDNVPCLSETELHMNLLCPNCQKLLTIPDQNAGQTMKCPLCNGPFAVPALPQAPANQAYSTAAPSALAPASSAGPSLAKVDFYSVAAETPAAPARRLVEPAPANVTPESPPAQPTARTPPPPPPLGYTHTRTLTLSPRVVPWIAPVCLVLLFVLLFFPWLGMYPAGIQVYTQSGWGTAFGTFSRNLVWEKVNGFASAKNPPGVSMPMILYVLVLVVLGLPTAVIAVLLTVAPRTLPPGVQRFKPWRLAIVTGVVLLTTVLLVFQLLVGFSLENTLQGLANQQVESELQGDLTPEEKDKVDLKRAQFLSQFNIHPTFWLRLALYGHLLALAGVGLDFWLHSRGDQPLPRLNVMW